MQSSPALLWVARAALLAAAISGVRLARRRVDHRPFAALLVWLLISTGLRAVLAARFKLLRPLGAPPLEGAARAAFHVDEAIGLGIPTALAITAIVLFVRRREAAVLLVLPWIGGVVYLATHYPEIRGEALRSVYLAAELGALAIVAASIVTWAWRRERPTPARIGLLLVTLVEGGLVFLAHARGWFWVSWDPAAAGLTLLYLTLTIMQVLL